MLFQYSHEFLKQCYLWDITKLDKTADSQKLCTKVKYKKKNVKTLYYNVISTAILEEIPRNHKCNAISVSPYLIKVQEKKEERESTHEPGVYKTAISRAISVSLGSSQGDLLTENTESRLGSRLYTCADKYVMQWKNISKSDATEIGMHKSSRGCWVALFY